MSVSRSFFDRLEVGFGVDLGTILAVKSHPNRRKNGIDFEIDFRCLACRKWHPIPPLFPGRGGPGGPLICARFQQEKMKRLELNKKRRPKQEKGSTVLIIVQIIVGFCVSQADDLTRPGQGPANFFFSMYGSERRHPYIFF